MADITKELCCASSDVSERCTSCQDSCSCAQGCQCSTQLQARPCAGGEVVKGCGTVCRCSSSCPCRKGGCSAKAVDTKLCDSNTETVVSCTMPGNCNCSKGSIGKL
ncbi:metallothionein 20-II-like isoform X2 [Littorina saxatilis]|uniref:Uncharacterized protein n=1 Tax=Littorina saxatilis TaxID=31220 RepID=A0AAN9BAJ9_9CAEN